MNSQMNQENEHRDSTGQTDFSSVPVSSIALSNSPLPHNAQPVQDHQEGMLKQTGEHMKTFFVEGAHSTKAAAEVIGEKIASFAGSATNKTKDALSSLAGSIKSGVKTLSDKMTQKHDMNESVKDAQVPSGIGHNQ